MAGTITNLARGATVAPAAQSPFASALATRGASVGPIAAADAAGGDTAISPPPVNPAPATPTPGYVDPKVSSVADRQAQAQAAKPPSSGEAYAYNYLLNKGLSPAMAAGVAGNLYQESAFSDDVLTGKRRGDNGRSAYAAQWQGQRLRNLEEFARSRGETIPSLDTQLDFVLEEAQPGSRYADAGAVKAFKLGANAQSPIQAADLFRDYYERPSADDRASRRKHAARIAGIPVDEGFVAQGTKPASVLDRVLGVGQSAATSPYTGFVSSAEPQSEAGQTAPSPRRSRLYIQPTNEQAQVAQTQPGQTITGVGSQQVAEALQRVMGSQSALDQRRLNRKQALSSRLRKA